MARTLDELNGRLTKVQMAFANEHVKYVMEVLKEIGETKLTQDMLAGGEEAVRALGFQQGIGVIKILPDILMAEIAQISARNTTELKSKLKI